MKVTDEMVDRFLNWPLPQTFAPDCGITFKKPNHPNLWPIGTNLLTAVEARQMLEYVLADSAQAQNERPDLTPGDRGTELFEYRKRELYELMSDISEECYCAGWMHGNEFRLWDAITDPNDDLRYGMGAIEPHQVNRLRELALQLDGWWIWEDDREFIGLQEWHRRLAKVRATAVSSGQDSETASSADKQNVAQQSDAPMK